MSFNSRNRTSAANAGNNRANNNRARITGDQLFQSWAWAHFDDLTSGETFKWPCNPDTRMDNASGEFGAVLRCVKHQSGELGYLLNCKLGWSDDGECPQELRDMFDSLGDNPSQADLDAYFAVKNTFQVVLSFNPATIRSHQIYLDKLSDEWRDMDETDYCMVNDVEIDVIGLRFAADATSVRKTKAGVPLWNFRTLEIRAFGSTLGYRSSVKRSNTTASRDMIAESMGVKRSLNSAFVPTTPTGVENASRGQQPAPQTETAGQYMTAVKAAGYPCTIPQAKDAVAAGFTTSAMAIEGLKTHKNMIALIAAKAAAPQQNGSSAQAQPIKVYQGALKKAGHDCSDEQYKALQAHGLTTAQAVLDVIGDYGTIADLAEYYDATAHLPF